MPMVRHPDRHQLEPANDPLALTVLEEGYIREDARLGLLEEELLNWAWQKTTELTLEHLRVVRKFCSVHLDVEC